MFYKEVVTSRRVFESSHFGHDDGKEEPVLELDQTLYRKGSALLLEELFVDMPSNVVAYLLDCPFGLKQTLCTIDEYFFSGIDGI